MNARSQAVQRADAQIEESRLRAVASREAQRPKPMSALESLAARLALDPQKLQDTLAKTAFASCTSYEEFLVCVMVANEYELNPLTKEIYAFPKRGGGVVPMVAYDGWIKIMNRHPMFDGIEYEHIEDEKGDIKAVEGIIYRKDRTRPTKKMVYLDEFKMNTDPWKQKPRHMLDVRCTCQAVRLAFGITAGIEGVDDIDGGEVRQTASLVMPTFAPALEQGASGQVIDQHNPQTGEVLPRDPQTGMTQVDEETARALDAGEGRADDQYGDQHDGTATPNDDGPTLDQALEYLQSATTIIDLNRRFDEVKGYFVDDAYAAVSDERDARAKALRGGKA
jgi:hypothetical protein